MKITCITDQILFVEPDRMAGFSGCAGLVVRSDEPLFIDMNIGEADLETLVAAESPAKAVITHFHLDHSTWLRQLPAGSSAVPVIPDNEAAYLTDLDFVMNRTAAPFDQADQWHNFMVDSLNFRPLETWKTYGSQTRFPGLETKMVPLPAPGHSPGHTVFYFPGERLLFAGDMGLDRFGPWYGWLDCDPVRFARSIIHLKSLDIRLVLTSHGGILDADIPAAWDRALDSLFQREKRISRQLDQGIDEHRIVAQGVFYTQKTNVPQPMRCFLDMWDTAMFRHHRDILEKGGLASCL